MDPFRPWPTPYVVHKWAVIVGLALWTIGIIAGKLAIIAAGGVAFIAAGVAAMIARRSLLTGVTIGFLGFDWTKEELAEMAPGRRLAHALVTAGVLVLLGVASLVFLGTSLRHDWQRARRAELEKARGAGTWKPDINGVSLTFGAQGWFEALAIGGDRICYSATGLGIVSATLHCKPGPGSVGLGGQPVRRLRFTGERLLWAAAASVGVVQVAPRLISIDRWNTHGLPRTLAGTHHWVAWDEGSAVIVGKPDAPEPRRFELRLPPEGPVVLAALGERLLFGPAPDCTLSALDLGSEQQECVIPGARRPVAADVAPTRVAVALEDGDLFTLTPTHSQRWAKVASPLAISTIDSALFIVATNAVYRLRTPATPADPLFAHTLDQCEAAGRFGEFFAWQFGKEVRVVRLDAKPLEPFELP